MYISEQEKKVVLYCCTQILASLEKDEICSDGQNVKYFTSGERVAAIMDQFDKEHLEIIVRRMG